MVKKKARALTRDTRQTGTSNMSIDRKRKALAPGKRISKKGNIYFENRRNRSDVKGIDTPIRKRMVKRKLNNNKLVVRKSVIIGARNNKMFIQPVGTDKARRIKVIKAVKKLNRKLGTIRNVRISREPLRGVRRHDLLPLVLRKRIPKLYSQEGKKNPIVYAKFFSPYSQYTLYITEFDGKDTLYGYAFTGQGSEWGYSSFKELVNANRRGLPLIERDKYFSLKNASKIKDIKRLKR